MNNVIKTTNVWCCDCQSTHKAEIYEKDNSIFGYTACPVKNKTVTLSRDAQLWQAICAKSHFAPDLVTGIHDGTSKSDYTNRGVRLFRLDITNACNLSCHVCYANASAAANKDLFFLDIITAQKIAVNLQKEGAKEIAFTGGEPTLHPQLESIITVFRKAGLKTAILTNGLRIAQEEGYAKRLKKSGLRRAYIQFETFDNAIHEKIRGNAFVEEKKKALVNCKSAKIKTSVIAVMVKENLNETGALINHMKNIVPRFGEIVFVTAIREAGRFNLPPESFVYKEEIIKSIVNTSAINDICTDNFYPFPVYRPFGINVHPNSNVILPLLYKNGTIELFENYININKFYRLLNNEKASRLTAASALKAIVIFLSSLKYKKILSLLWILFCYITKMGNTYINYVMIQSFLTKDFQDMECLNNCNAYHTGAEGKISSACVYNQDFKSGHSFTRYTP